MSNEALIALFGTIGSFVGAIRWLMNVNYKQSVQLQNQKREQTQKSIDELKAITDDLKKEIKTIQVELKEASTGFKNNQLGFNRITDNLKDYIDENKKRFSRIETEIIRISDETTLYRTKQSEKKKN